MKTKIKQTKKEIAYRAEQLLKQLLKTYEVHNFHQLGEICNSVCILKEYSLKNDIGANTVKARSYIRRIYDEHIVLVLSFNEKYYGYTRNNILKFIRGESKHGASEVRDNKRKALRDFIFEEDNLSEYEFAISWNWILGPNVRASEGNFDSKNGFVHQINLDGRELNEISLIESIVLFIAFEYWQVTTGQTPIWTTKCQIQFEPGDYANLWGKAISDNIANQKGYWIECLEQNL